MTENDLRQLETEVEAARAKLTGDISTLRSPSTFSDFTENLKQAAMEKKDSFIDDARSRTRSAIDEMVENVKAKAAANPAAVLVIGAGLAWHLLRRPPIVTALVGGGLYSLMRTKAAANGTGQVDHMAIAKENLKGQARDMMTAAGDMGQHAADYAVAKATDLSGQAKEALKTQAEELMDAAGEMRDQATDFARTKAAAISERTRQIVERAPLIGSDRDDADAFQVNPLEGEPYDDRFDGYRPSRDGSATALGTDRLLLGAAGIAIAAALAFAYQRRDASDTRDGDR
ncbi:hypothetical protein [Arvimicrobium flavum]|uniref:hypothetical protein n=1 Tax=Arvimicrobium flavum TaxID=3393320 RepID=UPI00237BA493|nr:hypothetical protein [Mesorhizobium shangrilense]